MEREKLLKRCERCEKINKVAITMLFIIVAAIEVILTIALFKNGEIFRGKEKLVIFITASIAFVDLATVVISQITIKILERKLEI